MNVNTTGMKSIIFAWRGSPITGVIFCWMNIEIPIRIGRMYVGSCAARSQIQRSTPNRCPKHRNGAFCSSTDTARAT